MSDTEQPSSPAEPRPNGEPYYIDSECPECDRELVLYHNVGGDPDASVWYDEWCCPDEQCRDGIFLDWPQSQYDWLNRRIEKIEAMDESSLKTTEEVAEALEFDEH